MYTYQVCAGEVTSCAIFVSTDRRTMSALDYRSHYHQLKDRQQLLVTVLRKVRRTRTSSPDDVSALYKVMYEQLPRLKHPKTKVSEKAMLDLALTTVAEYGTEGGKSVLQYFKAVKKDIAMLSIAEGVTNATDGVLAASALQNGVGSVVHAYHTTAGAIMELLPDAVSNSVTSSAVWAETALSNISADWVTENVFTHLVERVATHVVEAVTGTFAIRVAYYGTYGVVGAAGYALADTREVFCATAVLAYVSVMIESGAASARMVNVMHRWFEIIFDEDEDNMHCFRRVYTRAFLSDESADELYSVVTLSSTLGRYNILTPWEYSRTHDDARLQQSISMLVQVGPKDASTLLSTPKGVRVDLSDMKHQMHATLELYRRRTADMKRTIESASPLFSSVFEKLSPTTRSLDATHLASAGEK